MVRDAVVGDVVYFGAYPQFSCSASTCSTARGVTGWTRTQAHATASRATFVGPWSDVKTCGQVATPYYGVRPVIQVLRKASA